MMADCRGTGYSLLNYCHEQQYSTFKPVYQGRNDVFFVYKLHYFFSAQNEKVICAKIERFVVALQFYECQNVFLT